MGDYILIFLTGLLFGALLGAESTETKITQSIQHYNSFFIEQKEYKCLKDLEDFTQ